MKLYHVSSGSNRQSILTGGIHPTTASQAIVSNLGLKYNPHGVYFFTRLEAAQEFGFDNFASDYAIFQTEWFGKFSIDPEYATGSSVWIRTEEPIEATEAIEAEAKTAETFVNLTPHEVRIYESGASDAALLVSVPASGQIARVSTRMELLHPIGRVPIYRTEFGKVTGLPETPRHGIYYIVSAIVLEHCRGDRDDLLAPGELLRDADGRPVGCIGLRR